MLTDWDVLELIWQQPCCCPDYYEPHSFIAFLCCSSRQASEGGRGVFRFFNQRLRSRILETGLNKTFNLIEFLRCRKRPKQGKCGVYLNCQERNTHTPPNPGLLQSFPGGGRGGTGEPQENHLLDESNRPLCSD